MDSSKIFDESYVECNDCGAYWNDQCDGLPLDRVKHCNSYYKATRNVDIPKKIEKLDKEVNTLRICLLLMALALLLQSLGGVFGV